MTQPQMLTLPPRESFADPNLPTFQTAWDSTSLGAAKKCWRFYQLSIVLGYRRKANPALGVGPSLHLRYGNLYHRALEVYDHKTFEGMPHEEAIIFVLRDLAAGCQDWTHIDTIHTEQGMAYGFEHDYARVKYVQHKDDAEKVLVYRRLGWWDPEEFLSDDKKAKNNKTIPTLFRTVIWYLDQFGEKDPAKTLRLANGKPAVELSFRFDTGIEVAGIPILYSGHMDRVVEFGGQNYVLDRKTTGTTINGASSFGYFAQFNPNNQMTGYCLAAQIGLNVPAKGVIIDAAQIAKGFSRFERHITPRTEEQMAEWLQGLQMNVRLARIFAEQDFYPMNETACDHYGGCEFREVCKRSPSVRQAFLNTDFTRQFWDPLDSRGEI
jgi:hypothetical protein